MTIFEKMRRDLPSTMIGCPACDDAQTQFDLVFACETQLDLINEGQDGTEYDDPQTIKRWLRKWSKYRSETE